jgi:iron(III) transport system substrate-binding protein
VSGLDFAKSIASAIGLQAAILGRRHLGFEQRFLYAVLVDANANRYHLDSYPNTSMSPMNLARKLPVLAAGLFCVVAGVAAAAEPLVVYSAQKEPFIRPMLDAFTRETGIEVQVLTDQGPVLVERLAAEGKDTRADVLLTVDVGNLWAAGERGLLAKTESETLAANVPVALRDSEGRWFGLSRRARAIAYSTERVEPSALSTYAALAGPEWKGRLCLRTSKNVYNQSLVATLIDAMGEADTEAMVRGWVENLATTPTPDDTLAIKAVAGGECDVAVVNMYYLARLKREDPSIAVAMFWPDQAGAGTHVNLFGGGVTAHARQPEAARQLLEWWSGAEAQALLAANNLEYPANPAAHPDPVLAAFGEFRGDHARIRIAGPGQAAAVRLMDRAGWR